MHVPRDELEATLEARRELGAAHEAELTEAFVERIGRSLDKQVDERIERRLKDRPPARRGADRQLPLALASLGVAIPLTAIAVSASGIAGLLIVWIGIVLVNIAARTH